MASNDRKPAHEVAQRRHWLVEEVKRGMLTLKDMAERLECSYSYVAHMIQSAGYRNRLLSDAEWEQVLNERKRR